MKELPEDCVIYDLKTKDDVLNLMRECTTHVDKSKVNLQTLSWWFTTLKYCEELERNLPITHEYVEEVKKHFQELTAQ